MDTRLLLSTWASARPVGELADTIRELIAHHNEHRAFPYEWTYTGKPLASGEKRKSRKRSRYRRQQLVNMRSR